METNKERVIRENLEMGIFINIDEVLGDEWRKPRIWWTIKKWGIKRWIKH